MTLHPKLAGVRSSLILVPAALAVLFLAGWRRATLNAAPQPALTASAAVTEATITFPFQGRARSAVLIVPTAAPPATGFPVVLLLHGAGGSGKQMLEKDGWRDVATRERFAVIAADGTPKNETRRAFIVGNPRTWNSGIRSGLSNTDGSASAKDVDDVSYLAALLDSVAQRTTVNTRRVYVAGHSNGGGMSYRFAAEHPERVAAVGVMAGHLSANAPAALPTPVPLLQIVGDHDPLMPMSGGVVKLGRVSSTVAPALDSPTRWASMLGIHADARIIRDDSVTVRQWGNASSDAVVLSYVVKGHGHAWLFPGADPLPGSMLGPRREAINATETMWAFFAAHARR